MSKGDTSVMNTDTRGHEIRKPWSDSELARRINRRYRSSPGLISTAPFTHMASGTLGMAKGARPLLSRLQRLWMPVDRNGWPQVSYVWHERMYGIGASPYQDRDMHGDVSKDRPLYVHRDMPMNMSSSTPVNMPINTMERHGHPGGRAPSRLQTRIAATGKAQIGSAQTGSSSWTGGRVVQKRGETITAPVLSSVRDKARIHVLQEAEGKARDISNRPVSAISPEPHSEATDPVRFTPREARTAGKATDRTAETRRVSIKGQTSFRDDTSRPMIPQTMDFVTPQPAHFSLISHFGPDTIQPDTIQPAHSMHRKIGASHTDPMPIAKNQKATGLERPSNTPAHVIMKSGSSTSPASPTQSPKMERPAQQEDMVSTTGALSSPNAMSYTGQASDGHRDVIVGSMRSSESGEGIPGIRDTTDTGDDLQKGVINSHASLIMDMPLTLSPKRIGGVGNRWANLGTTAIQRMNTLSRTAERPSYMPHALSHSSRMVRPRPLSSFTELSGRISTHTHMSTGKTPRTTLTSQAASRPLQLTKSRRVSMHTWHMGHRSALSESGRTVQPLGKFSSDARNPFPVHTSTSLDMPLAPPHGPSYAGRGSFSPSIPVQLCTHFNPSTIVQRTGIAPRADVVQRAGSEAVDISAGSAHDQGGMDISSGQDGPDTIYGSEPLWQGQDIEEIASRVYAMIEQRLIIERESLGLD